MRGDAGRTRLRGFGRGRRVREAISSYGMGRPTPTGDGAPVRDHRAVPNCPGGLILHIVGHGIAGCTYDDEPERCAGREARHEGDPTDCVTEWGGCNRCGVHEQ